MRVCIVYKGLARSVWQLGDRNAGVIAFRWLFQAHKLYFSKRVSKVQVRGAGDGCLVWYYFAKKYNKIYFGRHKMGDIAGFGHSLRNDR